MWSQDFDDPMLWVWCIPVKLVMVYMSMMRFSHQEDSAEM